MIAFVFSAVFIVYLLIPEALFRLIFGFFISSRSFVLTRTEKAYRAVLITILPFLFAWGTSWYVPMARTWPFPVRENSVQQRRADYKAVSAAFYSEAEFEKEGREFWHAATRCSRRQARLVAWYILFVGAESFLIGLLAANYPKLKSKPLKWLSNSFLTAYISQWHPLLPKAEITVQADILCVNDMLYQGEVLDYFLRDGELTGIILKNPRRFNRIGYLKDKNEGKNPETKAYWRSIPSQNMYFFADKILNMNLTYLSPSGESPNPGAVQKFIERIGFAQDVGKLSVSVEKPKLDHSK